MKRFKKIFFTVMLLLLAVVATACSAKSVASQDVLSEVKASKTVTWGVKTDTRLVGLLNIKTGKIEGFDVDIAREVSKRIFGKNVNVAFVPVTSNTRLPLLKNGNIDAIAATMTITPERKKEVLFSDPYFDAGQAIIVKQGSKIKSVKDLDKGTKVIGLQGSNSVDNIKKAAPSTRVLQLPDASQAFTALQSGQADAMTSDNSILAGLISDNHQYKIVGGTFTKEPYGIAVNKGQSAFVKKINQALTAMRKDGTYDKIVKKWFSDIPGFKVGDVE